MKKIYLVLFSGMVLLSFANCGKKDDDKKGTVDMSAMCYQLQTQSNGQIYQNGACNYNYAAASNGVFTNYGASSNMYSYTSSYGQTGCPTQTSPVYSASKGLGCVINSQISYSGQPAQYAMNAATATFITVSAPNLANQYVGSGMYSQYGYTGVQQGYNGLYGQQTGQTVFRACEDNDKCPDTQSCRPPVQNSPSRIGICYHN